MEFLKHLELRGKHAILAPSQPHWLGYDKEQLEQKYKSKYAQDMGTALHELAETLIHSRLKLKKTDKLVVMVHLIEAGIPRAAIDLDRIYNNFMAYVNDAIGFRLTPEQPLYYSDECFGTADAISFEDDFLRIHDYKSGITQAKMDQLLVYAAIFCLEYRIKPGELKGCELRIYQNDNVVYFNPTAEDILPVMDIIVSSCKYLSKMKMEG
jgi:hypothetical protein